MALSIPCFEPISRLAVSCLKVSICHALLLLCFPLPPQFLLLLFRLFLLMLLLLLLLLPLLLLYFRNTTTKFHVIPRTASSLQPNPASGDALHTAPGVASVAWFRACEEEALESTQGSYLPGPPFLVPVWACSGFWVDLWYGTPQKELQMRVLVGPPTDHVHIRFLHSGSKAQDRGIP